MEAKSQNQTKKIMIVDDNPDILNSLQTLFKMRDFEVVTVDNGRKCLQELEKGFKGIIILDIIMPVMDGIETIKNMIIEGFIEGNTIIVLTAKKFQGEEFDEIYHHIYEYVQKPFDINKLITTVEKIGKEKMKESFCHENR